MCEYKFSDFVAQVEDMEYPEMLQATQREGEESIRKYARENPKKPRSIGLGPYTNALSGMAFWLQYGCVPPSMFSHQFALLRPVCEKLVAKGYMKPVALNAFGKSKA